ncbi:MAG: hypothetical protein AB1746_17500, partial [Candidatus Zixiibacteriota bacterium]
MLVFSTVLCLAVIFCFGTAYCAEDSDSSASFNMLMAPASPGFILLGVEPVAIERPGTAADLTLTILNKTNNIQDFPKDVALEFMPYWMFWGRHIKYEDYRKDTPSANLLQSASISMATSYTEYGTDSSMTSTAFGLRFSILRGRVDSAFTEKKDSIV